jgi:hypothetical protein
MELKDRVTASMVGQRHRRGGAGASRQKARAAWKRVDLDGGAERVAAELGGSASRPTSRTRGRSGA